MIGSRPIKRKKNSFRMIIDFHVGLDTSLSIIAVLSNSLVTSSLHSKGFALFIRRQKLLSRSLAVRDRLVGFILHPFHVVHVIGLILDYKPGKYGHGVDDISFIFSFGLCGMSIFVSTVTEVSISFLLYFNLGLIYVPKKKSFYYSLDTVGIRFLLRLLWFSALS